MIWKFEQEELSNGRYALTGIRNTGNEVYLQTDESGFYRIFEAAYNLEVSLGTSPGKVLFAVISGARKSWLEEYNESAFGSWRVSSPDGGSRYIYDGNDFILRFYSKKGRLEWQHRIEDQTDADRKIFLSLL